MVVRAQKAPSGLNLSWALTELRKQLGGDGFSLDQALHKRQASAGTQQPGGSEQGLGYATPTSSDAASGASAHCTSSSTQQQQHGGRSTTPLSVHWADALEQHCVRTYAPLHAQHAPDKPCLKQPQSSFPFVEEAAQVDGSLLRRPWAASDGSPAKKRSRLAAFGQ